MPNSLEEQSKNGAEVPGRGGFFLLFLTAMDNPDVPTVYRNALVCQSLQCCLLEEKRAYVYC